MSVILGLKPLNAISNGTRSKPAYRTGAPLSVPFPAAALFLLTCAATLTIWSTGLLADRLYECCVFLLAGWILLRRSITLPWDFALPLGAIALWGFVQLALGATEDLGATLDTSLRFAAYAATAFVAYASWDPRRFPRYLDTFAWFGTVVAVIGVTAYYTSPHRVLWLIDAPYPDVWGPFLSRNNFAQFLELAMPAALWLAFRKPDKWRYWTMAAAMLAAGLVSASRAGAILLCGEAVAMFLLFRHLRIQWAVAFAVSVAGLAAIAGAGTLLGRLHSPNPLADRDRIYFSTLQMIAERPSQGYGLGTYALVYPEFATFDSGYRVEHAHNDWLEWAAEGGLPLAAVWAALAIPACARSFRHPWSLGIPAIFLHALADFPFAHPGVAAWTFALLGALAGAHRYRRREEHRET